MVVMCNACLGRNFFAPYNRRIQHNAFAYRKILLYAELFAALGEIFCTAVGINGGAEFRITRQVEYAPQPAAAVVHLVMRFSPGHIEYSIFVNKMICGAVKKPVCFKRKIRRSEA